jgi:tetratricopeptide (TPR) repeat protein
MPKPDPFAEIYRLAGDGALDAALGKLLDETGARLVPPFDEDLNHAWYVVGDLYFKKGDFAAAARAFDRSVADRPDDPEALMALANCYSEMDSPRLAERYLRLALKYSDNVSIVLNLGNALFDQEKYREAIEIYKNIPVSSGDIFRSAQMNIRRAEANSSTVPSDDSH